MYEGETALRRRSSSQCEMLVGLQLVGWFTDEAIIIALGKNIF
jgi:hypothetical protein